MKVTKALSVTLTRKRVIEASPFNKWSRVSELKVLYDHSPYPRNDEELFRRSWSELVDWYSKEAESIGEIRAFWGLVYRLLDNPTAGDITWIKVALFSYLNFGGGDIQRPDWMDRV
jgi:hypothetical protein